MMSALMIPTSTKRMMVAPRSNCDMEGASYTPEEGRHWNAKYLTLLTRTNWYRNAQLVYGEIAC